MQMQQGKAMYRCVLLHVAFESQVSATAGIESFLQTQNYFKYVGAGLFFSELHLWNTTFNLILLDLVARLVLKSFLPTDKFCTCTADCITCNRQ